MIEISIYVIIGIIYIFNLRKGKNWLSKLSFALIFIIYLCSNGLPRIYREVFTILFFVSILVYIYRVIQDSKNNWKKLAGNIQKNRKELMLKHNKEIFFFNNKEGIAFDKKNNEFEYITMVMSEEEDKMNNEKSYTTNGFSEQFQDDFFKKNEIKFYPAKDFFFDSQENSIIKSSKKSLGNNFIHKTETTVTDSVTVVLENGTRFNFDSLDFVHHTFKNPLGVDLFSNRNSEGKHYYGFKNFYKKFGLMVKP